MVRQALAWDRNLLASQIVSRSCSTHGVAAAGRCPGSASLGEVSCFRGFGMEWIGPVRQALARTGRGLDRRFRVFGLG